MGEMALSDNSCRRCPRLEIGLRRKQHSYSKNTSVEIQASVPTRTIIGWSRIVMYDLDPHYACRRLGSQGREAILNLPRHVRAPAIVVTLPLGPQWPISLPSGAWGTRFYQVKKLSLRKTKYPCRPFRNTTLHIADNEVRSRPFPIFLKKQKMRHPLGRFYPTVVANNAPRRSPISQPKVVSCTIHGAK